MRKRNVNATVTTFTNNTKNGILPLDEETRKSLKMKHLEGKQYWKKALLNDRVEGVYPIYFEAIDDKTVCQGAAKNKRRKWTI